MSATKTYRQFLDENPNFTSELAALGMDTDTQDIVEDWFFDRIICDDNKFPNYFKRLAKRWLPAYRSYVRIEAAKQDFEPMVTRYIMESIEGKRTPAQMTITRTPAQTTTTHTHAGHTVTDTPAETTTTISPAETTDTLTPAETTKTVTPAETTDETSYDSNTTRSGSSTVTDKGTTIDTRETEADSKQLLKTLPMSSSTIGTGTGSISQGGASAEQITSLDWTDASQQQQKTDGGYDKLEHNFNDSSHETSYSDLKDARGGKDTTTHTSQNAGTEVDTTQNPETNVHTTQTPGTEAKTTQTAGTRATVYDNDEVISVSSTAGATDKTVVDKDEDRSENRVLYGAENLTPQAAIEEALNFLYRCATSDMMLCDKLEPAFLSTYGDY